MVGKWRKHPAEGTSGAPVDDLLQMSSLQRLAREKISEMEVCRPPSATHFRWQLCMGHLQFVRGCRLTVLLQLKSYSSLDCWDWNCSRCKDIGCLGCELLTSCKLSCDYTYRPHQRLTLMPSGADNRIRNNP